MKKIVTILLAIFVIASAIGIFAMTSFALTQNDGWYEIGTAEELLEFRSTATNGAKAKLTADIDMTDKEWTPFDAIVLQFDGQGHTISNINLEVSSGNVAGDTTRFGLFANVITNGPGHTTIKNVTFKDCSLTVNMNCNNVRVGLVAGYADRAAAYDITLKNCDLTLKGTASGEVRGGMILGTTSWGHDGWSWFDGTVGNSSAVGGNVDADSTFDASAATIGTARLGGIIGATNDGLYIVRSQFKGTITGPAGARIASYASDIWNKVVYYDCATEDGDNTYKLIEHCGGSLYYGTSTAEGYNKIVSKLNSGAYGNKTGVVIMGDIDFAGTQYSPITSDFIGVLYGRNHTFSNINLTYNDAGSGRYSIIANFLTNDNANGTVRDLTLKNSSITVNLAQETTGDVMVGGIAGAYNRGHVENISLVNVDVALNGYTNGEIGVGGVCGKAEWAGPNGTVGFYNITVDKDSSVTMNAGDSTNARAGGIVGRAGSSDRYEFDNCVNYANVYGSHTAAGIIGASGHWNNPANVVKNSKNYGNVYGKEIAASLVGVCDSATLTVTDSTAGGFISGGNEVYADVRVDATKTNLKVVAILNPITTDSGDNLVGYYQKTAEVDGKISLRVIFLAKQSYVEEVDALNIDINFTLAEADVWGTEGALGNVVYQQITADGDVFTAPDGIVMFGYVITGIPVAETDAFSVTVTDGKAANVFTGNGTIG